MKHVVLEAPNHLAFGESPDLELAAGEALVQVHRVGICGTDIHAYHGRQPFFEYPRILGHELGVEVIETSDPASPQAGSRCAVEPYLNDPQSQASRRGKTNCCESLQVLGVHIDGGLRPYIKVPAAKLHPSEELDFEALALVETLCIGAHAEERSAFQSEDRIAVLGAGPIGLSILSFVAGQNRHPVTVVDLNPARLAYVQSHVPNTQPLDLSTTTDPREALLELLGGDLPTVLFDATGNATSMHRCFDLAAHGATIVFVGLFQGEVAFEDPLFHRKELTLKSSRNATGADFQRVIRALETGQVETASWLTHQVPFSALPTEFEAITRQPDLIKATVHMGL